MAQLDVYNLTTLIGEIYNAALEPRFWQSFLQKLQQVFCARSVGMCHTGRCFEGNNLDMHVCLDFDPAYIASYNDYYKDKNILLKEALAQGMVKPGAILPSRGVLPFEIVDKSEFFNDWVRPQGVEYYWAPVITLDESSEGMLTLGRDGVKGDLDEEEMLILNILVPHLQQAFAQHRRFCGVTQKSQALLDSLDQVPSAVVLVGGDGTVIEANRRAEEIDLLDDGITIAKGSRLMAAGNLDSRRLSKCISLTVETSKGDNIVPGGVIQVERPSGKRPYKVVVSPIKMQGAILGEKTPYAVVFILDSDGGLATSRRCLCEMFELTPAEARLAQHLAVGKSLDEAAEELDVSKNTLKTLLQRIYSKTNTNRQGELISLLLRCNISLGEPCELDNLALGLKRPRS